MTKTAKRLGGLQHHKLQCIGGICLVAQCVCGESRPAIVAFQCCLGHRSKTRLASLFAVDGDESYLQITNLWEEIVFVRCLLSINICYPTSAPHSVVCFLANRHWPSYTATTQRLIIVDVMFLCKAEKSLARIVQPSSFLNRFWMADQRWRSCMPWRCSRHLWNSDVTGADDTASGTTLNALNFWIYRTISCSAVFPCLQKSYKAGTNVGAMCAYAYFA